MCAHPNTNSVNYYVYLRWIICSRNVKSRSTNSTSFEISSEIVFGLLGELQSWQLFHLPYDIFSIFKLIMKKTLHSKFDVWGIVGKLVSSSINISWGILREITFGPVGRASKLTTLSFGLFQKLIHSSFTRLFTEFGWSLSKLSLDQGRVTPWTSRQ